ncbi:MAG: preprotein translocase subunit YajC, partial [Endomicrobia bacterium]|nr:preprotein translocase subunit YajC [Endomicrobiia bacterium]
MKRVFNFTAFALLLSAILAVPAFAQDASSASPFSALGGLTPLLLIFVFFYLFLLRPQQKKAKE